MTPAAQLTACATIFSAAVNHGRTPNGAFLQPNDRELLRALAEAWGEDNIVPVRKLAKRLDFCLPEAHEVKSYETQRRAINHAAERLRNDYGFLEQGLVLGSYRNYEKKNRAGLSLKLHGLFWITNQAEAARWVRPGVQQALSMIRFYSRVTRGPLAELSRSADSQYQLIFGADPATDTGARNRKRRRR